MARGLPKLVTVSLLALAANRVEASAIWLLGPPSEDAVAGPQTQSLDLEALFVPEGPEVAPREPEPLVAVPDEDLAAPAGAADAAPREPGPPGPSPPSASVPRSVRVAARGPGAARLGRPSLADLTRRELASGDLGQARLSTAALRERDAAALSGASLPSGVLRTESLAARSDAVTPSRGSLGERSVEGLVSRDLGARTRNRRAALDAGPTSRSASRSGRR
jgi:hypothetical protein